MKTTLISQELQRMKMFIALVAALPMFAAGLPMCVSIGVALANRYTLAGRAAAPGPKMHDGNPLIGVD